MFRPKNRSLRWGSAMDAGLSWLWPSSASLWRARPDWRKTVRPVGSRDHDSSREEVGLIFAELGRGGAGDLQFFIRMMKTPAASRLEKSYNKCYLSS